MNQYYLVKIDINAIFDVIINTYINSHGHGNLYLLNFEK